MSPVQLRLGALICLWQLVWYKYRIETLGIGSDSRVGTKYEDKNMKGQKEFITNDSGTFWCWAQRIWVKEKKPVMAAEIELMMASWSDSSARIFTEDP